MANTKEEVLAIVRAVLDEIIHRKRQAEAGPGPMSDLLFQYALGAMAGGFEVLRALERHLK